MSDLSVTLAPVYHWCTGLALLAVLGFVPASCSASDSAGAATAVLIDGRSFTAALRQVTGSGDWVFQQAEREVTVPRQQLVTWGACRDHGGRTWMLLADGTLLVASLLAIEPDQIVIAGRLWPDVRVPRSLVRAIVFCPPAGTLARDLLVHRAVTERRNEDCLLLDNGDELRGNVPQHVKPEPGAFHCEKIMWSMRGAAEPLEMPLSRAQALLFAHSGDPATGDTSRLLWIGLRDGSRLLAKKWESAERSLAFDLAAGTRLVIESPAGSEGNPLAELVFIQSLGGIVTYVSDLEATGYKHIPFLSASWPYQRDRSVAGGHLRAGDCIVLKGVGMHSSSTLAYELAGQYRELQAELAIDELAGVGGSVVFRVYLQDDAEPWRKAYESDVVRGGQSPIPMRVSVRGAARMALIVDFADRADQWDYANWLNARLVR